jgi:DNA-binding IclR family transcriptional regulator
VVLAHLPIEESRGLLERPRAATAQSPSASDFELRQKFGEIRRTGIMIAPHGGRTWVSAPIFDETGRIRSTVSAVVAPERCNAMALSRVVRGTARAISQGLRRELGASAV